METGISYRKRVCCCLTAILIVAGWGIVTAGCAGKTKRIDPDSLAEVEVGTGLTSQDFRSVCQRMARSLVQLDQIQKASTPPRIVVTEMQNETDDPLLRPENFTRKIRTELVKHAESKMLFVDRDDNMVEKVKQENRDKDRGKVTGSALGTRSGADFFLTGRVENMRAIAGGGESGYYRLSFRLTDAASGIIVWEDDYEIKKVSTRADVYR